MRRRYARHLRAKRREWHLTQGELARLLNYTSGPLISRFEKGWRKPNLRVLLGYEVIFGATPRDLFPDLYESVEEAVIRQAYAMQERLSQHSDRRSRRKLRLIKELFARAVADNQPRS